MKNLSQKNARVFSAKLQLASAVLFFLAIFFRPMVSQAQTFSMAAEPNSIYPLPDMNEPTTMPMAPSGTFYNGHSGGSCYNYTTDFNGDTYPDEVYVWAINFPELTFYPNSVAYEVIDGSGGGGILCQGVAEVGSDITELNVGMYKYNNVCYLVVAYWNPVGSKVRLRSYSMSTTGLTETDDRLVAASTYTPLKAEHISLDCHDMKYITVAWEDLAANSICIREYEAGLTLNEGPVDVVATGSGMLRFPDIAMSHQGLASDPASTTGLKTHLAFVDVASGTIYKYTVDFDLSGLSYSIDDMIPLSSPVGSRFDEFQLKIDAPDHYTTPQPNWSMVYYNNDTSKINLRMCNHALFPAINSYVVNDGTLSGSSGDISMAGNAFPSVSYHPDGDKVYVAWFSNYDQGGLSIPSLYGYQNLSVRYLSVIVDDNGNQVNPDYQLVDVDYRRNFIYDYPKICLSKHNDSEKLFTVFSCHGATFILPAGSSSPIAGTAKYLVHKAVNWWSPGTSPFYRPAPAPVPNLQAGAIEVYPNPFSQSQWFRLNGGCATETYTASLLNIEGKMIASYKGTIDKINTAFASLQSLQMVSGIYILKIGDASGKQIQQQLLTKQ